MDNPNCIRCQEPVNPQDNFIKLDEFEGQNLIRTNYCHKVCWRNLMDSKSKVNEAFGVLKELVPTLREHGLLKDKEVVIQ